MIIWKNLSLVAFIAAKAFAQDSGLEKSSGNQLQEEKYDTLLGDLALRTFISSVQDQKPPPTVIPPWNTPILPWNALTAIPYQPYVPQPPRVSYHPGGTIPQQMYGSQKTQPNTQVPASVLPWNTLKPLTYKPYVPKLPQGAYYPGGSTLKQPSSSQEPQPSYSSVSTSTLSWNTPIPPWNNPTPISYQPYNPQPSRSSYSLSRTLSQQPYRSKSLQPYYFGIPAKASSSTSAQPFSSNSQAPVYQGLPSSFPKAPTLAPQALPQPFRSSSQAATYRELPSPFPKAPTLAPQAPPQPPSSSSQAPTYQELSSSFPRAPTLAPQAPLQPLNSSSQTPVYQDIPSSYPQTSNPVPEVSGIGSSPAPDGCKKLPIDSDWPPRYIWDLELPGWEPIHTEGLQKHPQVLYRVWTVESAQRAVVFAARYNIRLSIYNSGHDFLGRNDAPSGILLNVNGLKGVRVLESWTSTLQGAPPVHHRLQTNTIIYRPGAAVTFGGGINTLELNEELGKSGMWTVGAAHPEVSVAGGWSLSGGHATLSHYYGLGSDNALEYKLITADGNLTIANTVSNPDLFWALRGGGGGTFGVVVEATFKAYELPKVISYQFFLNTTSFTDNQSIFAPTAYFASQMPRLVEEGGISGYIYVHPNAIRAQLFAPNEYADEDRMKNILNPILDRMATFPGINPKTLFKYPPRRRLVDWLNGDSALGLPPIPRPGAMNLGYDIKPLEPWHPGRPEFGLLGSEFNLDGSSKKPQIPQFEPEALDDDEEIDERRRLNRRHGPGENLMVSRGIENMDSRLLGAEELNSPNLAEALRRAMPFSSEDGQIRFHLVAGSKTWAQGLDSAVNPAWRRTYAHLLATGSGTPNAQSLRDLSPNSGAYSNEAWVQNPNWKYDFWGSNYNWLSHVKSKWDPDMIFYVTPGINADLMSVYGDRLCKFQGPRQETKSDAAPLGDNRNIAKHFKDYVSFPSLYRGYQ